MISKTRATKASLVQGPLELPFVARVAGSLHTLWAYRISRYMIEDEDEFEDETN